LECSPIVKAFREDSPIRAVKNPHTVAVAIECGDPIDGKGVLRTIRDSGGFAESVTDKEILRAREMLGEREGLFAEPGGAAAFAGLVKSKHKIEKGSKVVCLVTGHGLKSPRTGVKGKPIDVSGDVSEVKKLFR
jgi:threonine synthase